MSSSRVRKSTSIPPELVSTQTLHIAQRALDESCSAEELGRLAAHDPVFAARLLSVVNSPAFGLSTSVDDVPRAAALLGVRRLRNLALGLVVSAMPPPTEAGQLVLAASVRRGVAAMAVAEALGLDTPERYFPTGLFLEVGTLMLVMDRPDIAVSVMNAPARQRVVMEREHGLEGHPVVGAQFVEGIGLPATIESSIRHHHDPEPPQDAHGRVGWLAEIVAAVFEGGATAVELARASRAGELLGLDAGTIEALLDELPERIRAESGSFGRDLGPVPDLADLTRNANQTLVEMNLHYEDLVRRLEAVIAEKDAIARELERANAKLSDLATTDELTRMPNKRALTTMIDQSLAQLDRRRGVISLIVIDVDHFKRFNDTWGHAVGDEVLRVVGKVLMAGVRAGDLAGRYGGEEFVVVLPNTDPEGASVVGERLRASLERTAVAGPEGDLHVTASFGIASVRGPGCKDAAKELFERADAALYDAKRTGRNRVALAA